jgi:hypothetical protein
MAMGRCRAIGGTNMADPAPATTGFLGVFFTVILVICLASVGFAGYVVWRGQSAEATGAAGQPGVSDDQQGAGALRPVEEAPPQQQ